MEIWEYSAQKILSWVLEGELSAQEVLDSFLSRTADVDPQIRAFTEVLEPEARFGAAKVDAALQRGDDPGIMAGIPCGVKDNISVIGAKCTCGSKMLAEYVAPYDATAVRRLRSSGAVLTGKTNLDEFAMGSSTGTSFFGPTHNPWDLDRVPGGSSGGSAAAVAAGMVPVALGSDTGGSVRQPASFSGICGLKPTYGLVSRYGLVSFASSLDCVGPLGASVWDCALVLEAVAGSDIHDSGASRRSKIQYTKRLGKPVKGIRAGVPRELVASGKIAPEVRQQFEKALERFGELGVIVEETSLPLLELAPSVYKVLSSAEASSNLARFDGVRYGFRAPVSDLNQLYGFTRGRGFGGEVKRRVMLGTLFLSQEYYGPYYEKAAELRTLLIKDFRDAFESFDILLCPTAPVVAFKEARHDRVLSMYPGDALTVPANLAGIPALSVPCGFAHPQEAGEERSLSRGLPCGLQIMAKPYGEETLLNVGCAYEEARDPEVTMQLENMRRRLAKECQPV